MTTNESEKQGEKEENKMIGIVNQGMAFALFTIISLFALISTDWDFPFALGLTAISWTGIFVGIWLLRKIRIIKVEKIFSYWFIPLSPLFLLEGGVSQISFKDLIVEFSLAILFFLQLFVSFRLEQVWGGFGIFISLILILVVDGLFLIIYYLIARRNLSII